MSIKMMSIRMMRMSLHDGRDDDNDDDDVHYDDDDDDDCDDDEDYSWLY